MADDESRAAWKKTFDRFDNGASGEISRSEVKDALTALGQKCEDAEVDAMLQSIGISSDNVALEFDDFYRLMTARDTTIIEPEELDYMFKNIDLDRSGYLKAAELRHFLAKLKINLSDGEISQLIVMYDLDGKGQITFAEFKRILGSLGFVVAEGEFVPEKEEKTTTKTDGKVVEEDPTLESKRKMPLDSIQDADLRAALEAFDHEGDGQVCIGDIAKAGKGIAENSLHWSPKRELYGLGPFVHKVNHITLIVSDVDRSTRFYNEIMGFQQIRRPNFDAHGAWFTMGNCELHLIKGNPVVHSGEDLIVGHISIETTDIGEVPSTLRELGIPFRQNVSMPSGADAGSAGTNTSSSTSMIVHQYFIRDPDGYYLEVCNCGVLTKYCLAEADELPGYEEGTKGLSLAN